MWKWFKTRTNLSNQSNKVKGGININGGSNSIDLIRDVLKDIKEDISHIRGRLDDNIEDTKKLKRALNIYVENNGVKPHVKKIVKEILDEQK